MQLFKNVAEKVGYLFLYLYNASQYDEVQYNLFNPGEPVCSLKVSEIDGKDIEDDDEGYPEDQDCGKCQLYQFGRNAFYKELRTEKYPTEKFKGGDAVEKQFTIPSEHTRKFTGNLAAQALA